MNMQDYAELSCRSFSHGDKKLFLFLILIILLLVSCEKFDRSDKFLIEINGKDFASSIIKYFERDGYLEFSEKIKYKGGFVTVKGKFYDEHHFDLIYYKESNSPELVNYHKQILSITVPSLNKMLQFPYSESLIPSVLVDKKLKEIITSTMQEKTGSINIFNEVTKNIQTLTYKTLPYPKDSNIVQVNFLIGGMKVVNLYTETGEKVESLSSAGVHTFHPGFSTYLAMNMFDKSAGHYRKGKSFSENIDLYGADELKVSFCNFPKNFEAFSDMHQKVIFRNDSKISFIINNSGIIAEDKQLNKPEYLEQNYSIESKHNEINSLVNRLLISEDSNSQKCAIIIKWMQISIEKVDTEKNSALQVLKNKKADCQGFANLAVAMLRASGLPAKVVYGVYLNNSSNKRFSFHAWIEVKIDNYWIAKDPIFELEGINIYYIKLYDSSLKDSRYNFNKLINSLMIENLEVLKRKS